MPSDLVVPLLLVETVLFAVTMALTSRAPTRLAGEYVGVAFHLLLLPLVAELPGGEVVQGAGLIWVACDVVVSVGLIWTPRDQTQLGQTVFTGVRMAGHLFAGTWIVGASYPLGTTTAIVGTLLAIGFAGYTLAAGRLPQQVLAVPGVLLVGWLLLLALFVDLP